MLFRIPPVFLRLFFTLTVTWILPTVGFRIIEHSEGQGFPLPDDTDILTVKKFDSYGADDDVIISSSGHSNENIEIADVKDNLNPRKSPEFKLDNVHHLGFKPMSNFSITDSKLLELSNSETNNNNSLKLKNEANLADKTVLQTREEHSDSISPQKLENFSNSIPFERSNGTLDEAPTKLSSVNSFLPSEDSKIYDGNYQKISLIETTSIATPDVLKSHTQRENVSSFPKNSSMIAENSKKREESNSSLEDIWKDLEKTFRSYTDTVMKKALPKFLRIHSQLNISSQCNGGLLQLTSGLRKLKSWAVKMVDASGRLPSGSLEGTLTDLGEYDQCLDVEQPKRNKHVSIHGKYCTLELKPLLPALQTSVTLNTKVLDFGNTPKDSVLSDFAHGSAFFHFMVMRIGVCIPSPCVADDIRELASALLKKVPVEISVRNCEIKQDSHITIPQFIVISMIVVIAILLTTGTIADNYSTRSSIKTEESRVPQSLLAFSLKENLRQLMKCSQNNSNLGAVNGIRCLSLIWIVLAHTYGFGHRQGLSRLSHAKTYMDDVFFQIITNAWVSVDTFFLLGGLLVAMSNLKKMESTNGKINYVSHVIHRLWRLTPPMAATLGVMFLLPLVGSGPLWSDMVGQKVANCEQRWWQIFLPINTWIDFSSMCLLHTWYVASDIHFYCLAPMALIILFKWPVLGFGVLFLTTAGCSLVTGILTLVNNLPPTVIFFSPDVELTKRTANLIYFRPYPHIGAYCVGLAVGYILWKQQKWALNKMIQGVGWIVSSTCCLAVLFATYSWSRGAAADTAESVIYAAMHRTIWAIGVAWVLFICATGHGGALNKLLSWQLFTPLSRLCYFVYLLHFPVLWVRVSWRRSLLHFHHYDIITEFLGILMITFFLSIVFHLSFEAPFLKLEQIWFPQKRNTANKNRTVGSKPVAQNSTNTF